MSYGTSYDENSWDGYGDDPRTPKSTHLGASQQHHRTPIMTPVLTPVGSFISPIGGMFDNVGALHSPSLASHFHRKGSGVASSGSLSLYFLFLFLLFLFLFLVFVLVLFLFLVFCLFLFSFIFISNPIFKQNNTDTPQTTQQDPRYGYTEDDVTELDDLSEDDILYILYGSKGWRYNRFFVTLLASLPLFIGIFSTTLYLPAITSIRDYLGVSNTLIAASVSICSASSGITPLIYGPLCDRFGRRTLLLLCLPLFMVGCMLCGFAYNSFMLLGGRFIMGLGMGANAVAGLGAMADVWPAEKRSTGITITFLPAVIGPIIASPLGGYLTDHQSWRWCCLLPGFMAFILYVIMVPLFPETLPSKIAPDDTCDLKYVPSKTEKQIQNPFVHLKNYRILVPCVASAFIMATLSMTATIQNIILDKYYPQLTPTQIGYCGLPIGVGTLLGAVLGGILAQKGYMWKGDGGRLLPAYIVGILTVFCLIAYSNFIETDLVIGLTISGIIGMLVPASRPGMYALAIGQNPEESSSITGLLHVIQFCVAAPLGILGPLIMSQTSVRILYLIPALCIVVSIVPLGVMVGKSLRDFQEFEKNIVVVEEDSEDYDSYDGEGWGKMGSGGGGEEGSMSEYDPVPSPLGGATK